MPPQGAQLPAEIKVDLDPDHLAADGATTIGLQEQGTWEQDKPAQYTNINGKDNEVSCQLEPCFLLPPFAHREQVVHHLLTHSRSRVAAPCCRAEADLGRGGGHVPVLRGATWIKVVEVVKAVAEC